MVDTAYKYTPKRLVESLRVLQAKEEQAVQEAAASIITTTATTTTTPTPTVSDGVDSVVVAAVQLTASGLDESSLEGFWTRAQQAVEEAVTKHGANLILLPELFLGPYFCQSQEASLLELAVPDDSFIIQRMQALAKQYKVVLPISIYERKQNALYNSMVMIDADGAVLGTYRKSHIPDGTGYQEKFYFTPGDSGFLVWKTRLGITVGVAICWDQWFPEAARAMALQGADVLMYPTAIGTEPQDDTLDSSDHWQRTMQGHGAANMIPVVASNRFGTEILLHEDGTEKQRIRFYGRSFITDNKGAIVTEAGDTTAEAPITILTSTITPAANRSARLAWGLFRDRRPELYDVLLTKDGCKK